MSKLPIISGLECIKILKQLNFYIKRRESSHIILRRNDPFTQIVIPDHKELDKSTLRAIIRQAGLNIDEFINLIKNQ